MNFTAEMRISYEILDQGFLPLSAATMRQNADATMQSEVSRLAACCKATLDTAFERLN